MNSYNYKWIVRIGRGYFMAGVHRFRTKKEAQKFVNNWHIANKKSIAVYADIPTVKRADFITHL